jgi:hypothetical protein
MQGSGEVDTNVYMYICTCVHVYTEKNSAQLSTGHGNVTYNNGLTKVLYFDNSLRNRTTESANIRMYARGVFT